MPRRLELRVYDQAKSFADAARLLNAASQDVSTAKDVRLTTPSVATSAFAIELYLKAISLVSSKRLHGHDLTKLYDKLPENVQAQIQSEFTAVARLRWGRGKSAVATFEMMKDSYLDWRYPYETKKRGLMFKPGDALMMLEALDNVCHALHEAKGWE